MFRSCLFASILLTASLARAAPSVVLTDVVKSNGIGDIALFKDVNAATLEAFRLEGGGALVFAVDVNEAADGSESATSQGVALASVVLRVTIGGTEYSYSSYSTATQALLAPEGSTTRQLAYTLTGDSGSNRITGQNAVQQRFDSLITVPVDRDLSSATNAVLEVRFLQTNAALGDPEAFYDFTNGFEDLALVNQLDATYIETLDAGQNDAPAVILTNPPPDPSLVVDSWTQYPSATTYYTVGYEDLFPRRGDYDFNDLVVAYQVRVGRNAEGNVVSITGTAFLVARGAGLSHDWHLRILTSDASASGSVSTALRDGVGGTQTGSATFSGTIDVTAFTHSRQIFPPSDAGAFTNTTPGSTFSSGPRFDFTVSFDQPLAQGALAAAPFDPYIVVRSNLYEVHLPGRQPTPGSANVTNGHTSFVDANGFPFAFLFPANWRFPWERTDLGVAYPRLLRYVTSAGGTDADWYQFPETSHTRSYGKQSWFWSP